MKIKVGVNGACGRMGSRIVQLVQEDPETELGGAVEPQAHPGMGQDIGELCGLGRLHVPLAGEMSEAVDVVIDFSSPEGAVGLARWCVERRVPLVIATTGLSADQRTEVHQAAHTIPLVTAPNMSLGVNLLLKLVGQTASALKDAGVDIEILERHHRFKKDAPSGTALEFARVINHAAGEKELVFGRQGLAGERPRDQIGVHAIRVGDNVGEHTILFSLMGETVELTHRAHSRDCYARGALRAAKFLVGKAPGLYGISDVLGL